MSLLSDFFIATPTEVEKMNVWQSPFQTYPTVQTRSVEIVKVILLQCIIDGSKYEEHLNELGAMIIRSASDEGPWIFSIPKVVIEKLAEADESKLDQYGSLWAETEEWTLDRANPKDVIDLIKSLGLLSRKAVNDGRGMYLWICL